MTEVSEFPVIDCRNQANLLLGIIRLVRKMPSAESEALVQSVSTLALGGYEEVCIGACALWSCRPWNNNTNVARTVSSAGGEEPDQSITPSSRVGVAHVEKAMSAVLDTIPNILC